MRKTIATVAIAATILTASLAQANGFSEQAKASGHGSGTAVGVAISLPVMIPVALATVGVYYGWMHDYDGPQEPLPLSEETASATAEPKTGESR